MIFMDQLTRVRLHEGLDRGLELNSGLACYFLLNFQARISALSPTINFVRVGEKGWNSTMHVQALIWHLVPIVSWPDLSMCWPLKKKKRFSVPGCFFYKGMEFGHVTSSWDVSLYKLFAIFFMSFLFLCQVQAVTQEACEFSTTVYLSTMADCFTLRVHQGCRTWVYLT